jgi:hypothetical protein
VIRDPVRRRPRRASRRKRRPASRGSCGRPATDGLLVLTDAKRVASGMAEGRHRDLARTGAADVDHQQPERGPDRGVRAIAWTEDAEPAVEPDALADRPIRSTRSRVGGTTGSPSVTPLSNQTSNSSGVATAPDAIPSRRFPTIPGPVDSRPGDPTIPTIGFMTLAVTKGAILGGHGVPVSKTERQTGPGGGPISMPGPPLDGAGFPVEPHEKSRVFTGGSIGVTRAGRPCSKALEK